jgi:hypothetical protein
MRVLAAQPLRGAFECANGLDKRAHAFGDGF